MYKSKQFFMILSCFILLITNSIEELNAQVTIGSGESPLPGSILTLSEGVETKKGLLLPRVQLSDMKSLKDINPTNTERPDTKMHIGLTVYNVADDPICPTVESGIYVWNGAEWKRMGDSKVGAGVGVNKDQEGNAFKSRAFGSAGTWMIENLAVRKFADGTPINPHAGVSQYATPSYTYPNATSGSWSTAPDTYKQEQGLLYNWTAATKNHTPTSGGQTPEVVQGICPNNWHLPSDAEWNALEKEIYEHAELYSSYTISELPFTPAWNTAWETGTESLATDYRGSSDPSKGHGNAMKGACHLPNSSEDTGGKSTNNDGFTALLLGFAEFSFVANYGVVGYFWTSSAMNDDRSWFRYLHNDAPTVGRNETSRSNHFSVRCKKN